MAFPDPPLILGGMKEIFPYILFAAMGATALVLVMGLLNMFRRDKNKNKRANNLMKWRVILQAAALALFAILLFAFRD